MADFTIGDQQPRRVYTVGNTPQGVFTVPFPFLADTDVHVVVNAGLADEPLTLGADYTVTGAGGQSGTVTLIAPVSNCTVTVYRELPLERSTRFPAAGTLKIPALNNELDRLVMMNQQQQDGIGRSLKLAASDDLGANATLPVAQRRAGRLFVFDGEGRPVMSDATVAQVEGVALAAWAQGASIGDAPLYVGDGARTRFATGHNLTSKAGVLVEVGGVRQAPSAYSLDGEDVVLSEPAPDGAEVHIRVNGVPVEVPDASGSRVFADAALYARPIGAALADRVNVFSYVPPGEHAAIRAGTSSFDCAGAFEAARDALPQGGVIVVPRGTYPLGRDVIFQDRDITVAGDGPGATVFRCVGGCLKWYQPTVSSQRVYFAGLKDASFTTSTTDTLTAVHMEWGYLGSSQHRHFEISNVVITIDNVNNPAHRWARGVYLKNAWGGEVKGLIANNAIGTTAGTALFFDGLSARNVAINVQASYWDRTFRIGYDAATKNPCEGIRFLGCEGIGCNFGYDFWLPADVARPALAIDVTNGHASAAVAALRARKVEQSSWSHNVLYLTGTTGAVVDIDYGNNLSVSHNFMAAQGGGGTAVGINLGTGGTSTFAHNKVSNINTGISVPSTWYMSLFKGTLFYGVANYYGGTGNSYPATNYNRYEDDVNYAVNLPKPAQTFQAVGHDSAVLGYASLGAYAGQVLKLKAARAGSSGFAFLNCESGDGADSEFRVGGDGTVFSDGGTAMSTPADYAEMIREWWDGNPDHEDRVGRSVVLVRADDPDTVILHGQRGHQDARIRLAADFPGLDPRAVIGVISGNPAVMGGAAWNAWAGKHLLDDYNRPLTESAEALRWVERVEMPVLEPRRGGDPVDAAQVREVEHVYPSDDLPPDVTPPADAERITLTRRVLNPAYDPAAEYTPRAERPEWSAVGLLGRLWLRPGDPVGERWVLVGVGTSGVEEWLVR